MTKNTGHHPTLILKNSFVIFCLQEKPKITNGFHKRFTIVHGDFEKKHPEGLLTLKLTIQSWYRFLFSKKKKMIPITHSQF